MSELIAVIDTETNFIDELISAGIVVVDSETFEIMDTYYGVFDPEYKESSLYGNVLWYEGVKVNNIAKRAVIFDDIQKFLDKNGVKKIFAYNAKFDYGHMPELGKYAWYDIMGVAAYKQYNKKITDDYCCCKSGRLKTSYGVEPIYRMLSGNASYREVHNGFTDARDEMMIMKMLGVSIDTYEVAKIN